MGENATKEKRKRSGGLKPLRLIGLAIAAAAIVKELRTPKEDRTWQGTLGFIPYDFRMPTAERIRHAFWDPEGPIITSRAFGVGWTLNFGAVAARFRSASAAG